MIRMASTVVATVWGLHGSDLTRDQILDGGGGEPRGAKVASVKDQARVGLGKKKAPSMPQESSPVWVVTKRLITQIWSGVDPNERERERELALEKGSVCNPNMRHR
jgi:hypothetical protein